MKKDGRTDGQQKEEKTKQNQRAKRNHRVWVWYSPCVYVSMSIVEA